MALLIDHLVGAGEQRWRYFHSERPCSLEIDHQLVFGWRLHRQLGWFLAFEDAIHLGGGTPKLIGKVRSVGDETAIRHEEVAFEIDGRQFVLSGQS